MTGADRSLEVWLVEAWYSGSHRAWADGYAAASRHRVRLFTHDGRFWRWRLRGAAATLAEAMEGAVAEGGRPDVVLATTMVDVASLLGLARRTVGGVPVVVYCHESQLVHPPGPGDRPAREFAVRNWLSLLAADEVWFNSAHHRDALLAALPGLLAEAPDHTHVGLLDRVTASVAVMPPGVDLEGLDPSRRPAADGGPPLVLWNQRWDHDKDPAALFRALVRLDRDGVGFRLALAGENRRADPREFAWVRSELAHRIVHVGHVERARYLDLLLRTDVVASTARHEFFGMAVVEAMAAGAVPVLPAALGYPELVPAQLRPVALYPRGGLGRCLRAVLGDVARARRSVEGLAASMQRFAWPNMAPRYDEALTAVVDRYGAMP